MSSQTCTFTCCIKNNGGFKMASYTLDLSPVMVNLASEGSLDTALLNGVSLQRTGYIEVSKDSTRKIVVVKDGETFNDTMQVLTDLSNSGHNFIS